MLVGLWSETDEALKHIQYNVLGMVRNDLLRSRAHLTHSRRANGLL